MMAPKSRRAVGLLALSLTLAILASVWGIQVAFGAPAVDLGTEWRHVPVPEPEGGGGGSAIQPGGSPPGGIWDALIGVAALGVLGLGLALQGKPGGQAGHASAEGSTFLRGLAKGVAGAIVGIVVGVGVVLAAGMVLTAVGIPTAILVGIGIGVATVGIGVVAVSSYRQRATEAKEFGIPMTASTRAKLAMTAVGDLVGISALIEGARGHRLVSNRPLLPEERGELFGEGLVQAGTTVFAVAKSGRLLRPNPSRSGALPASPAAHARPGPSPYSGLDGGGLGVAQERPSSTGMASHSASSRQSKAWQQQEPNPPRNPTSQLVPPRTTEKHIWDYDTSGFGSLGLDGVTRKDVQKGLLYLYDYPTASTGWNIRDLGTLRHIAQTAEEWGVASEHYGRTNQGIRHFFDWRRKLAPEGLTAAWTSLADRLNLSRESLTANAMGFRKYTDAAWEVTRTWDRKAVIGKKVVYWRATNGEDGVATIVYDGKLQTFHSFKMEERL